MGKDSSDEENLPSDWVLYANRREWADVTPIEQDDGENPVVVISYSEVFQDVFNYFRAILASGEKSERALELTHSALKLNAANYTVWQYRRDVLKALNADLNEELAYIEEVIEDNPKNYQVWHHRRVIVEWLNDASQELALTANILCMDAKNYHAWQHRQWAILEFKLFDDELVYVDRLIAEDIRNNSAWNQRYFVLKHTGFTPDVLQRELHYVMNRIRVVKNNESSWNFLRGLLQQGDGTLTQFPEVTDFVEDLYKSGIRSPFLLAFLVDLYIEIYLETALVETETGAAQNGDMATEQEQLADKVFQLCNDLSTQFDTIRAKYWNYVANTFRDEVKDKTFADTVTNKDGNVEAEAVQC